MSAPLPASTPWTAPSVAELQPYLPQYAVEALLGHGGMGAVYQARQTALHRPVAIKVLPLDLDAAADSYAERFSTEARAMARLTHPGIVAVYDFGQTPTGLLYYVMELVDGTDVQRMITEQGRLSPEQALPITANVCEALAYAHANGVVHRDIKPANILISRTGLVKIADFGLARVDSPAVGLTQGNLVMGTPDYVAPEALAFGVVADHRADLYAVGVMLYYMLTAEVPRGVFEMPSHSIPGLDPRFDAVITRAMQRDPAQRYPTAQEMLQALTNIHYTPVPPVLEKSASRPTRPIAAPPASRVRSTALPQVEKGARPSWLIPTALTCVLAMSFGGWFVFKPPPNKVVESFSSPPTTPATAPATQAPASLPPAPAKPVSSPPAKPMAVANIPTPAAPVPAQAPVVTTPAPAPKMTLPVPTAVTPPPAVVESKPSGPPELAALQQQYATAFAQRVTAPHDADLAQLDASFTAGLGRALAAAQRAGNPYLAAFIIADQKAIAAHQPLPTDDDATPDSLKKLRAIYRAQLSSIDEARTTAHLALLSPYITRLRQLEADLTKASRIPDALAVKDYRDSFADTLIAPAK